MPRRQTVVLLYHRIASVAPDPWSLCVTPQHFEEHLQVLRQYCRVRLDQITHGAWSWKTPTVAISFDDGYADNLHNAGPLLQRYETPATFFITTGGIDSRNEFWWDELERIVFRSGNSLSKYTELYEELQPLQHDARNQLLGAMNGDGNDRECRPTHRSLTSVELRKLATCELFEIGAHTVTHPLLAAQSAEAQRWELAESKRWIEEFLDRPVTSMSYPYGGTNHYNQATVDSAERVGYLRAFTTAPLAVGTRSRRWEWGRFVVSDMDGDRFQRFLSSCCYDHAAALA